jgi:hypothetical protein
MSSLVPDVKPRRASLDRENQHAADLGYPQLCLGFVILTGAQAAHVPHLGSAHRLAMLSAT